MLTETSPPTMADQPMVFPWRQERLSEKMARVIAEGAPRSRIREAVEQLVLHLRRQGVPATRGLAIVTDVATRAVSTMPGESRVFGTSVDLLALIVRWADARYTRAD